MSTGPATPRTAAAIAAATGISWTDWVAWLDASDARGMSHPEIAALAQARMSAGTDVDVENAGWWAQSVTVAYEQQIGRRVPGQRQDGTFYVSASRTVQVEPGTAMAVWQAHRGESDSLGGFRPGRTRPHQQHTQTALLAGGFHRWLDPAGRVRATAQR